ncbi:hypothetical protein ZWY2020_009128 [Hordeum vulgare]|nr:hypothetical protein ZWY2020_009128 [Hordeum vulgare]
MNESTNYQIDQLEEMIAQDHVVHWELKRGERADIERSISISRYLGISHQDGSPFLCSSYSKQESINKTSLPYKLSRHELNSAFPHPHYGTKFAFIL